MLERAFNCSVRIIGGPHVGISEGIVHHRSTICHEGSGSVQLTSGKMYRQDCKHPAVEPAQVASTILCMVRHVRYANAPIRLDILRTLVGGYVTPCCYHRHKQKQKLRGF
jgi:hypothetical protein